MDIKIVDENGKEPIVENNVENLEKHPEKMEVVNPYEIEEMSIHQILEIDGDADKQKYTPEIKTLYNWVKTKTNDLSPENIKWTIRELQLKLGTPPFGEDRIKHLSRFAYLDMEGKRIEEEKKKYM